MSRFTFICEDEPMPFSDGIVSKKTVEFNGESLDGIINEFEMFLKGCGFLSLPVGGYVGKHIDFGKYYLTRNRYHLAIQGSYKYTVGDESIIVNAGDLIWFNNKLEHGSENVGNCVRVTFVFDVPHN